jgi:hypothetical protein
MSHRMGCQLRWRLCGGMQKENWTRAHELVDELETRDAIAVHAYLHRKGGQASNAEYWYERAGRRFRRTTLDEEWQALVEGLLPGLV